MQLTAVTQAGRPVRTIVFRSALAGLLGLGLAAPSLAVDKSWNAGNGDWGDPGNWTPFGVPLASDDIEHGLHALRSRSNAVSFPRLTRDLGM